MCGYMLPSKSRETAAIAYMVTVHTTQVPVTRVAMLLKASACNVNISGEKDYV